MEFLQTVFVGLLYVFGILLVGTLIYAIVSTPFTSKKKKERELEQLKLTKETLEMALDSLADALVEENLKEETKKQTKKTTKKTTKTKEK